jgi:pimeloyl-ACP methyl ester carboxylesterase
MKWLIAMQVSLCWISGALAQDRRYEEWYLRTSDSIDLYVKEWYGGKDTVIVVHGGFGATHDYMQDAVAGMESKYHFIFYDQRGSLLSPAPVSKLTFQKNVNDLYELVSQLKLSKVKLLCHSMGTLVGMEFLKQHPGLVETMVLTGPMPPVANGYEDVFDRTVQMNLDFLSKRPELVSLKEYYRQKGKDLTDKERTEYWRIGYAESHIYDVKKWRLIKGGRVFYNEQASVMDETLSWNYDYRALLDEVNTTFLIGEYDFIDFAGDRTRAQIKDYIRMSLKVIRDAGHTSWIDQPQAFQEQLHKALTKKLQKGEGISTARRR